jgi:ArsR family transcriptional regulator, lead/cadmium/zinc/bismuth-responsive transcriptional repressor
MDKKANKVCDVFCFNEAKVENIKSELYTDQTLLELSEVFKVVSDKNRAKILFALKGNELCVCDISHIIGVSISAVSHQLRILRNNKLVKFRNEGKIVFYSLPDNKLINLLEEGLKFLNNK